MDDFDHQFKSSLNVWSTIVLFPGSGRFEEEKRKEERE
jgi:hypothetical protein